jgi:hypothetical protein
MARLNSSLVAGDCNPRRQKFTSCSANRWLFFTRETDRSRDEYAARVASEARQQHRDDAGVTHSNEGVSWFLPNRCHPALHLGRGDDHEG